MTTNITWSTVADIRARYDGPATDNRINAFLEDAEIVILATVPDLQDRVDDGLVTVGTIDFVQRAMVLRLLNNPAAASGIASQTAGPFSLTVDQGYRGYLALTDKELDMLLGDTQGQAFSINLAQDVEVHDWPWWDPDFNPSLHDWVEDDIPSG